MSGPAGLALLAALFASACGAEPAAPAPRWNVVLVTLDTTRVDYLGCYGREGDPTPNLDALAADGARFDLAIATAGLTPVSHASILTGLENPRHGLRVMHAGRGYELAPSVPTLAATLREAGWRTGAFLSGFPVSERFGLDRGFEDFDAGLGGEAVALEAIPGEHGNVRWDGKRHQRRSDETTDAALRWLEDVDEPFLLWLHYWDPHDQNLRPPDEVVSAFDPGLADETDPRERVKRAYATEVHYVDLQIGRLLEALRADGRYERTLVVVTSDHGEGLWEHDWEDHKILYQEQIHVPLIVRLPSGPRGVARDELVRTTDIAPTVLEALGLPVGDVDGRPLQPVLEGRQDAPRLAYADALNLYDLNARLQESRPQDLLLYVMMDRRWKLILRPTAPDTSELYDLETDPDEANNLYAERPEVAARLRAELERRVDPFAPHDFGAPPDDPATLEALRELGYVDGQGDG